MVYTRRGRQKFNSIGNNFDVENKFCLSFREKGREKVFPTKFFSSLPEDRRGEGGVMVLSVEYSTRGEDKKSKDETLSSGSLIVAMPINC